MYNLSDDDLRRITELNHAKLWIALSEGEPGYGVDVLLTDRGGNMWVACFTGQGAWMSKPGGDAPFPPTHWMPLPNRPAHHNPIR